MWMSLVALVAVGTAEGLTDVEYYQMPQLFHLDDYNECFTNRTGVFCLGSFRLQPYNNQELMDLIQQFSAENCNFDHKQIYRGFCVSSRCPPARNSSLRSRFESCVDNITRDRYELRAELTQLDYCRAADHQPWSWRPVDGLDIAFAALIVFLVLINIIGTTYDVLRRFDSEGNKYLLAWSLKANWARLAANRADGDPRLSALKPAHGVKAITLIFVILAHSVMLYHSAFTSNPIALEKACNNPALIIVQNGTAIVQTFIMCSSFFLAYNLLLWADKNPKNSLGISLLPRCLFHRICRVLPAYIVVLGATMTWWSLSSDGPLWEPLVGGECLRCREKWWTHLLFVNNLVRPDVKCLIHTWFMAAEMQLYVLGAVLTLTLGGNPRRGMKVLAGLFIGAILANFLIAYFFELGSMLTLMIPRCMHVLFTGERSFVWLYQSPWNNLPSSLIGIFVAFLHYHLQTEGRNPKECLWFRMVYRVSVPGMFLWVFLGYFIKGTTSVVPVALFAAVDRAVLTTFVATAMFGFFNQIDSVWWRFLSWRGWAVLDRMSLSVYLLHWLFALMQLAARPGYSPATVDEIGGHFIWTVFMSYWTAVPLFLAVELPVKYFIRALLS